MAEFNTTAKLKNVRLSYAHLLAPQAIEGEEEKRYSCDVLIAKDDEANIKEVKRAIADAIKKAQQPKKAFDGVDLKSMKEKEKWHSPLKDGDDKEDPNYEGMYFVSPWSDEEDAPQIVDVAKQFITKDTPRASERIYSGCYVNITINFFGYAHSGKYGVGVRLGNVLTLEKGESFGGSKTSALADFADDFDEAAESAEVPESSFEEDDLL